ncbi:hypothetical protein KYTH80_01120 [Helicobacter pylori]|nr:hypothetical protein [Helicobacter pylori]GHP90478.1 hypothetical protein VN0264_08180 [Helicobacter pylori]
MNNLNNLSDAQINGMIDYLQNILLERGGLSKSHHKIQTIHTIQKKIRHKKPNQPKRIQKAKKLYLKLNSVKSIILKQGLFKV